MNRRKPGAIEVLTGKPGRIEVTEEKPNELENKSIGLEGTQSFEEMYIIIKSQERIMGDNNNYIIADLIIEKIKEVVGGKRPPGTITRTYGIRRNLIRLLSTSTDRMVKKNNMSLN